MKEDHKRPAVGSRRSESMHKWYASSARFSRKSWFTRSKTSFHSSGKRRMFHWITRLASPCRPMKSRMRDSSRDTAWTLCDGANSVLRIKHCLVAPPNAYSDRGPTVPRQRLHAARQNPHLPLVIVLAELHAAAQRVEADPDHRGVDLAVGPQSSLFGARPEADVRERAEMRLRGDVVHLPVVLLGETLLRALQISLQFAVVGAGTDVSAAAGERVVLLEHREGEEPERFLPHLLVQHRFQELQALLVVLRLEHEADVVQIDRLLRLQLLRPQQSLEQLRCLVLAAHLRHHQRDLDAISLVVHAGQVHKPIRARDHALHVPQTLLGLDQPAQQGLAVRNALQALQQHFSTLADQTLVEIAARPVLPGQIIGRILVTQFLVDTQRLLQLTAFLKVVRLLHLLARQTRLPRRFPALAASRRMRI